MKDRPCQTAQRCGALACLTLPLLLLGCGAGQSVVSITGDTGQNTSRALPLTGTYAGRLIGFANNAQIAIVMYPDASATAVVQDPVTGRRINLAGRLDSDRYFQLTGPELRLDGAFYGAYNPSNSTQFHRAGYRFRGRWIDPEGFTGDAEAWHEDWPPAPSSTGNSYNDWNDWDDDGPVIIIGDGPGDSGSGSGGGGNGGYQPPPSGGGDPPDTGGDPTSDEIILRRGR